MRWNNFYKVAALAVAGMWMLAGCSEDDEQTVVQATVGAQVTIVRSGDVTDTSLSVTFQPSDNTVSWKYALGEGNQLDAFVNNEMNNIVTVEGKELKAVSFDNLTPGTVYTVYAKAYNENGEAGSVSMLKFPTEETFNVEQDYCMSTSVGFTMDLSSSSIYRVRYYLGTPDDKENFMKDDIAEAEEVSDRTVSYSVNYFDLEPGKEYVFYAMAYDRMEAPRAIVEKKLTTKASGESLSASVVPEADNDVYEGTYTVTSSDAGKMIAIVSELGTNNEMIDNDLHFKGDIVNMLETWGGIGMAYTSENGQPIEVSLQTTSLMPEKALEAYVVLYDKEGALAGLQHFEFINVEKDPDAGSAKVSITIDSRTTTGGYYTFTANDQTLGFFYNTVDADWYDAYVQTEQWYEHYMHEYLMSMGQFWAYKQKTVSYHEYTGQPGKRYYAVACPMNANGIEGWGEMTKADYTTLSE